MIDARELNAQGLRVRDAVTILRNAISDPQLSLEVQYLWAVVSNLMVMLEQDADVPPGYFGSMGMRLLEINPFDGVALPPAVSREPPMPTTRPSKELLNTQAPPPDPV